MKSARHARIPKVSSTEGEDRGSWDPVGPGSDHLGRAGVTALAVATLEVYYRFAR